MFYIFEFSAEIEDDVPYVIANKLRTIPYGPYHMDDANNLVFFKLAKQKCFTPFLYHLKKCEQISSFFFIFSLLVSRFFYFQRKRKNSEI